MLSQPWVKERPGVYSLQLDWDADADLCAAALDRIDEVRAFASLQPCQALVTTTGLEDAHCAAVLRLLERVAGVSTELASVFRWDCPGLLYGRQRAAAWLGCTPDDDNFTAFLSANLDPVLFFTARSSAKIR